MRIARAAYIYIVDNPSPLGPTYTNQSMKTGIYCQESPGTIFEPFITFGGKNFSRKYLLESNVRYFNRFYSNVRLP